MRSKLCSYCNQIKDLTEYEPAKSGRIVNYCNSCRERRNASCAKAFRKRKKDIDKGLIQTCTICKTDKTIDAFDTKTANTSGYSLQCRACLRNRKIGINRDSKYCPICELRLPKSGFYKLTASHDGYQFRCKHCATGNTQQKVLKYCPICKEKRHVEHFLVSRTELDGRFFKCKGCCNTSSIYERRDHAKWMQTRMVS